MDDDSRMSETSSVRNRGQRHGAASTMGDLDGVGDAAPLSASHIRPQLRCNACWEPILPDAQSAETCYRTSCGHLFCVSALCLYFRQSIFYSRVAAGEMRVQALRPGTSAMSRLSSRYGIYCWPAFSGKEDLDCCSCVTYHAADLSQG
jgi:hypothetical protein